MSFVDAQKGITEKLSNIGRRRGRHEELRRVGIKVQNGAHGFTC